MRKFISIFLPIIIIVMLLLGVQELHQKDTNSINLVEKRYLEKSIEETGSLNVVTAIVLDYRGFDTFIEATVLFTSVLSVLVILKKNL